MERDVSTITTLKALGYNNSRCLRQCNCDELPCPLLSWLVTELRSCWPEAGEVRCDSGAILAGELKDILDVTFYPYGTLTSETLTPIHLKRITEFLVSELQAARMLKWKESHPEDTEQLQESGKEQRKGELQILDVEEEVQVEGCKKDERDVMIELAQLFQVLDMDPASKISDAYSQVASRLESLPESEAREPLLKANLSSSQWTKLQTINWALCKDYECRRQMMLKRFHVTLQSFAWGERGKERSALLAAVPPFSAPLESSVSVALLLAARQDQSRILPVRAGPSTSIHKVAPFVFTLFKTHPGIKYALAHMDFAACYFVVSPSVQVLMGSVPDRGGRPGEIEPPMPIFTRRSEGGSAGPRREKSKFQRREYSGKKKKK